MLDAPEEIYAPTPTAGGRHLRQSTEAPRVVSGREFDDDFADGLPDPRQDSGSSAGRQRRGVRFRFNGRPLRLPKTLWGRIFSGVGLLVFAGCVAGVLLVVRNFFLHDARFVVESSSAIQSTGNTHVTRAQLFSIFGEDVERNIFNIPLAERRAELERLPWIERASVMRLLPNQIRIAITERTPVAFVRQGSQLGMVDAGGVLLDSPTDAAGDPHYSFPVITGGIVADSPPSTRAARMKIFSQFVGDLDSTGEHISKKVSEVDLSDPEDVRAVVFEESSDVLVHFGDFGFLDRYRKFDHHFNEWRTKYPRLASVDMRYDRQVVLNTQQEAGAAEGQPSGGVPALKKTLPKAAAKAASKPSASLGAGKIASHAKLVMQPGPKPVAGTKASAGSAEWHMVVVKPHKAVAVPKNKAASLHTRLAARQ